MRGQPSCGRLTGLAVDFGQRGFRPALAYLGIESPAGHRPAVIAAMRRIVGPLCDAREVNAVFDAELWIWDARKADSWTFVTLPVDVSEEIRDLTAGTRRGFGSVRVRVAVGGTTWSTSIFPGSSHGGYVLPIKRAVRKAESLDPGDTATVSVELVDF